MYKLYVWSWMSIRTSDYGIMLSAMSTVAFIGGQKANKYCTKAMEHFQSSPHNNFEHIYECMANGFMKLGNINDCLRYYKTCELQTENCKGILTSTESK